MTTQRATVFRVGRIDDLSAGDLIATAATTLRMGAMGTEPTHRKVMNMVVLTRRSRGPGTMAAQRLAKVRMGRIDDFAAGDLIAKPGTTGVVGVVGTKAAHRQVVNMVSHGKLPLRQVGDHCRRSRVAHSIHEHRTV